MYAILDDTEVHSIKIAGLAPPAVSPAVILADKTVSFQDATTFRNLIGAEPKLSIPSTSGWVLSSSNTGIKSWVAPNAHSHTLADVVGLATSLATLQTQIDTKLATVTADTTSRTANTVYAAPNGAAGTATFRALVAADIPSLDTSKLTSGTLGVARGGTGLASWTQYAVPYASATTTLAGLAPNTTTSIKALTMTGTGSAGEAPAWSSVLTSVSGTTILSATTTATTGAVALAWTGSASNLVAADGSTVAQGTFAAATHTHSIADVTGLQAALDAKLATVTADTTSRTANTVYAAPNGSAGTATFRALVAADIPSLDASKITSGILAVSRGGTGLASWTQYAVPYASATTTLAGLAPNTTTSIKALTMTGTGSTGAAPAWASVVTSVTGTTILSATTTATTGAVALAWTGSASNLVAADGSTVAQSTFAAATHTHSIADVTGLQAALDAKLATVTADATSRTANTVYAAPNGAAGTATFRALVAADIPSLDTSKLTSGTLGVARGGTGLASWTQYAVPYASTTTTLAGLAPNTTTSIKALTMTGNGSAGVAPTWASVVTSVAGTTILSATTTATTGAVALAWTGSASNLVAADGSTVAKSVFQTALTNPLTGSATSGQFALWNGSTTQVGSTFVTYDLVNGSYRFGGSSQDSTYPGRGVYLNGVGSSYRSPRIDLRESDSLTQWSVENYFGSLRLVVGYNSTPTTIATLDGGGNFAIGEGASVSPYIRLAAVSGGSANILFRTGTLNRSLIRWDSSTDATTIETRNDDGTARNASLFIPRTSSSAVVAGGSAGQPWSFSGLITSRSILPASTMTYSLGDSGNKFLTAYAYSIYSDFIYSGGINASGSISTPLLIATPKYVGADSTLDPIYAVGTTIICYGSSSVGTTKIYVNSNEYLQYRDIAGGWHSDLGGSLIMNRNTYLFCKVQSDIWRVTGLVY